MRKRELLILFVLTLVFYGFFRAITPSEYENFPKGDAKIYTLMAIHFDTPEKIREPLPIFYTQRLFPAFMGFLLSYPVKDITVADMITAQDDTLSKKAININGQIRLAWEISNFISYFIQFLFLFLLLRHFKITLNLSYFMLAVYSMWFLTMRLYVNWVQMTDPWAFAFLSAASYFLVTFNTFGFLVAVVLGSLCKESVLFIVPTFIWKALSERKKVGLKPLNLMLVAFVPALIFMLVRNYPYFPSTMITPNGPEAARAALGESDGIWRVISDYLFLIKFHYFYKIDINLRSFLIDSLLIPFGTFSALSYFLVWHFKDAYKSLIEVNYWIPYIFLTFIISFNVGRHLIYLFPPVILLSAIILQRNYSKKNLLYMLVFLGFITFMQNEVYKKTNSFTVMSLSLRHQLELSADYNPRLADQYRKATITAMAISFAFFWLLNRSRSKNTLNT